MHMTIRAGLDLVIGPKAVARTDLWLWRCALLAWSLAVVFPSLAMSQDPWKRLHVMIEGFVPWQNTQITATCIALALTLTILIRAALHFRSARRSD